MPLPRIVRILPLPLLLSGPAAFAGTGTLPGHSLDTPGAAAVGAPASSASIADMWFDTDGDGIIALSEVKPGSQLQQRFPTRDKNHDGRLTPDEYYYTYAAPPAAPAAPAAPATTAVAAAPAPVVHSDAMWTDSNGDGVIDHSEIAPGSQLALRFATRDKNHDGRLTEDEYHHAR